MLRKTLPFLFILLAVLILVWSLPQCSSPPRNNAPEALSPPSTADSTPATPAPPPSGDAATALPEPAAQPEPPAGADDDTPQPPRPADDTEPSTAPSPAADSGDDATQATTEETGDDTRNEDATEKETPPGNDEPPTEEKTDNADKPVNESNEGKNPPPSSTADPPPAPSPGQARQQTPSTIILDGLQFATDSDQLVEGSEAVLENVITSLKNNPEIRLEIAGYTDDRGDALYNRILSRRRAEAVMIYLVEHGIDARRLTAAGYGSDDPIADNATEEGRRKNRRVELHIR